MRPTAFVLAFALLASAGRAAAVDPPKLAVIIVVDQMRADYIDRFKSDWTGGLKRLVTQGAWFTRAAYPYLLTVTCAGHATIATGAFPSTHGIFSNQWWDRAASQQMQCTEDPAATNIGYDAAASDHNSGYRLLVPTFADRMRAERGAHVVTLSVKARSAIMLAGHGGDAVTWLSERLDSWLTSSAFSSAPVPPVKAFIDSHPVDSDFGQRWTRLLPPARYRYADDGRGERPPAGWTSTFPHVLNGTTGKPDLTFRAQWDISPFSDAYLGGLAATLVERMRLGKHETTDILGVSFTATDLVGHRFGPRSQEMQDQLARLDRTLGTLFDRLDADVGRGTYVVALSADHGVTPIPEQLAIEHVDAGRIDTAKIVKRIEALLTPTMGAGALVAKLDGRDGNLYFAAGVYERLRASPALLEAVLRSIASAPGVGHVFRGDDLRGARAATEPWRRAAALSYVEGRSGDLVLASKPGWIGSNEAASHGTASTDDQNVPMLFMGHGIKAGRYDQPATPADIAPTLAAICGIAMPQAEGRVLRAALK
jgi:predicted AlkP superfamily pyrophosphatase or phosphodiesterase